jgi:hypothetical protein
MQYPAGLLAARSLLMRIAKKEGGAFYLLSDKRILIWRI